MRLTGLSCVLMFWGLLAVGLSRMTSMFSQVPHIPLADLLILMVLAEIKREQAPWHKIANGNVPIFFNSLMIAYLPISNGPKQV